MARRVPGVSPSGYDERSDRPASARDEEKALLLKHIEQIHADPRSSTIADKACGYPALPGFAVTDSILTAGFSINLPAAAIGDRLVAEDRVVRTGRTIAVDTPGLPAFSGEKATHVAAGHQTLIRLADRADR